MSFKQNVHRTNLSESESHWVQVLVCGCIVGLAVCSGGQINAVGPPANCSGIRVSGVSQRAAVSHGLLYSNNPGG